MVDTRNRIGSYSVQYTDVYPTLYYNLVGWENDGRTHTTPHRMDLQSPTRRNGFILPTRSNLTSRSDKIAFIPVEQPVTKLVFVESRPAEYRHFVPQRSKHLQSRFRSSFSETQKLPLLSQPITERVTYLESPSLPISNNLEEFKPSRSSKSVSVQTSQPASLNSSFSQATESTVKSQTENPGISRSISTNARLRQISQIQPAYDTTDSKEPSQVLQDFPEYSTEVSQLLQDYKDFTEKLKQKYSDVEVAFSEFDRKLRFCILLNEDGHKLDSELEVDLEDPEIYSRGYFTEEELMNAE